MKYFLVMEVARSGQSGIVITQRKYTLDLLSETGMLGSKPVITPINCNHKLGRLSSRPEVDKGRYQRLVGKLIYLSHTRPNIAFVVNIVSEFIHSPTEEHMEAMYRILRYLKGTLGKGLFFKNGCTLQVEAYTDADWAGALDDHKSTSGYCTFLGGNLVTWRSKK